LFNNKIGRASGVGEEESRVILIDLEGQVMVSD
jgi:hypothetical protein